MTQPPSVGDSFTIEGSIAVDHERQLNRVCDLLYTTGLSLDQRIQIEHTMALLLIAEELRMVWETIDAKSKDYE
jgi:hypothetical protein